jgi:signal transduction histidine kinase
MLHDFIVANREQIIALAQRRVRQRSFASSTAAELEHGIPRFLTQLAGALAPAAAGAVGHAASARKGITDSAALNGHNLLKNGFTVAQVVHGYGDVCQIVTELAAESGSAIPPDEFQVFNRCLDNAIAGAVTAYSRQRQRNLADDGTERLGVLIHELRNLLSTALLSFDVIKKGTVGVGGSTAAMHARSLAGLRTLVERSLAEIRLEASSPALERISLLEFIEEIEISAAMQAEGQGMELIVGAVDSDLAVDADWQLLASAVSNLLQNAFKYSHSEGKVSLTTRATATRIFIDVEDECGGLPAGKVEELFRNFTHGGPDHSGLGLGLSIARRAVRANSGELHARDLPGTGCVFTIELPRRRASGPSEVPTTVGPGFPARTP